MPRYTHEQLVEAAKRGAQGESQLELSRIYNIPYRTMKMYVQKVRNDEGMERQRRGPQPALPPKCESTIEAWVMEMQALGHPISRQDLLVRVGQVCTTLGIPTLGEGWYKGFLRRHPSITNRQAQVISRVRNEIDDAGLTTLFHTMAKLVIEEQLDGHRIFNMDETGFGSKRKSTKVLAAKGSDNVWAKTIGTSFHLTIVAAASAAGDVVPPLFIVPGRRIDRDVATASKIPKSAVTTSDSGFMNGFLFRKWLIMFASSVPNSVKRPIVLIVDGFKSHFSDPLLMARALSLQIFLVCLPANGTHLVQPLDVAVFGPFKKALRQDIFNFMVTTGAFTISKKDAVVLASSAWTKTPIGTNASSGFAACGLFPPSIAAMRRRLSLFSRGGQRLQCHENVWAKAAASVVSGPLRVPDFVSPSKSRKRKSVDVGGRLLTEELFLEIIDDQPIRKSAAKKAKGNSTKKKPQPSMMTVVV